MFRSRKPPPQQNITEPQLVLVYIHAISVNNRVFYWLQDPLFLTTRQSFVFINHPTSFDELCFMGVLKRSERKIVFGLI
jgi:hypothetical protein